MKFRTDFVTNSSSSSFVLAVRITLKNGKVLKHIVEGDPEGWGYTEVTATMSPQDIAQSTNLEELIQKLTTSVTGFDEPSRMINALKKLSSVNEIAMITINGDKYGRDEQHQYAHYTYHLDPGITVYDHGGDEYIDDEGSGGAIQFTASGIRSKHFGEAIKRGGYTRKKDIFGTYLVFDRDVEIDPEAMEKERQRLTQQKTTGVDQEQ